jgi:hypothetical protein
MNLLPGLLAVSTSHPDTGSGLPVWPFYLGLALWLAIVLVHGILQVRKRLPTDAG